jgi:cell wall-associated NlpC family hydrolase
MFARQLEQIIDANPRYRWGGAESVRQGLDCSGYLYLAAKRAGIPVQRHTALGMFHGSGGWLAVDIPRSAARDLDLVWFTLKVTRPHGHVGVFWDDNEHFTHAGRSRGVVVSPVDPYWTDKVSGVKRLTIGDDKGVIHE